MYDAGVIGVCLPGITMTGGTAVNYAVPRKRAIFTGTEGGLTPADLRRAYNIPTNLDGAGETIALLEFGSGYAREDIDAFARDVLGVEGYDLQFVSLDTPNDQGRRPVDMEATLDVQWALALAPKARIVVYEAPPGNSYQEFGRSLLRALRYVINDRYFQPSIISISYGDAEENFADSCQAVEAVLRQAAESNISVFAASGDQGAYGEHDLNRAKIRRVEFPACCPHAIAVGGTSLVPQRELAPRRETAWTARGRDDTGATGGGFSSVFDAPDYQWNHLQRFDVTGRGVPDVAAVADPDTGCVVVFNGRRQTVGGTSLATPVWAGICALLNQATGKRAGFFPPRLYADPSSLHDIVAGNNSFNSVPGYRAGPGWDPCTGLGSPDVGRLVRQFGLTDTPGLPETPAAGEYPAGRSRKGVEGKTVLFLLVLGFLLLAALLAVR